MIFTCTKQPLQCIIFDILNGELEGYNDFLANPDNLVMSTIENYIPPPKVIMQEDDWNNYSVNLSDKDDKKESVKHDSYYIKIMYKKKGIKQHASKR